MRFILPLLFLSVSFLPGLSAHAGLPDPEQCQIIVSSPPVPCQFRFRPDGGLDQLHVEVIVIHTAGMPIAGCGVRASLKSTGTSTAALCACSGTPTQIETTDENGRVEFVFRKIGGHGEMQLVVETVCTGTILLGTVNIAFTSTDLNGSGSGPNPTTIPPCTASPSSATDVVDMGMWASGLAPAYDRRSDYDCSGSPVNVVDLGLLAGGLGVGCTPGGP